MNTFKASTQIKGNLNFSLQALDAIDWGADGCGYRVFYRENVTNATWTNITTNGGCSRSFWIQSRLLPNTVYEIAIRAENSEGPGPTSPSVYALSGQSPPLEPPTDLTVLHVDSSTVELQWAGYPVNPPKTVDGYWVCYYITFLFSS